MKIFSEEVALKYINDPQNKINQRDLKDYEYIKKLNSDLYQLLKLPTPKRCVEP